jgi:hypothetical protein
MTDQDLHWLCRAMDAEESLRKTRERLAIAEQQLASAAKIILGRKSQNDHARVLARIESILVEAGEACPENYQNGFDWVCYMAALEDVKSLVRDALTVPKLGPDPEVG